MIICLNNMEADTCKRYKPMIVPSEKLTKASFRQARTFLFGDSK